MKDLATDKKERDLIPISIWIAMLFLIFSIIGFQIYDRYKEYKQEKMLLKVINDSGQIMNNLFRKATQTYQKPIVIKKTKIIYVEKKAR